MNTKKEILSDIERLTGLKEMVQAYEEIAATRMRRIRDSVLQTRDFLDGINQIFHQVQSSYKNEIVRLMKQKKIKDPSKVTFLKRNGKTVFVLLSANTGLYGNIIKTTFDLFLESLRKETTADAVIIGRLGIGLFKEHKLSSSCTEFEFPDNDIDRELLAKIVTNLLQYEKIIVFHGLYQTMITQKPVGTTISESKITEGGAVSEDIKYFFEPSLEKIMAFFETEIFASVFEQTLHESQLAKFSSRMVVLDQSTENIKGSIKKAYFEYNKFKHRMGNRKQLSRLSGMALWKI